MFLYLKFCTSSPPLTAQPPENPTRPSWRGCSSVCISSAGATQELFPTGSRGKAPLAQAMEDTGEVFLVKVRPLFASLWVLTGPFGRVCPTLLFLLTALNCNGVAVIPTGLPDPTDPHKCTEQQSSKPKGCPGGSSQPPQQVLVCSLHPQDNTGITIDMASGRPTRKFGTSLAGERVPRPSPQVAAGACICPPP